MRRLLFLLLLSLQHSFGFASFADRLDRFPSKDWKVGGGKWAVADGGLTAAGAGSSSLVLSGVDADDFQLDVELRVAAAGGEAGLVFRASGAEKGADAFQGYYVCIRAGDDIAAWTAHDSAWRPIASRRLKVAPAKWVHLRILAAGNEVKVYLDGNPLGKDSWPVFDGVDAAFKNGSFALRAPAGMASFRNFSIQPYRPVPPAKSYTNPVQANCADPVVLHYHGKYYAYTTYPVHDRKDPVSGIRLYTSSDLVTWNDEGFALQNKDSYGASRFWAPEIVERDGTFYLYYAAEERMCVATAKSPLGPFVQQKKEPMLPESLRIDGSVFTDDDGRRYFYYVTFNNGNEIWGGRLKDDMMGVDPASLHPMVRPDQPWERHGGAVTEGPEMLKHKGTYYLTYSGSHFKSPDYAVGYATSSSPLGPWKKYGFNPVMKSTSYAHGCGHHCFIESPDGKELFIVYHRHLNEKQADPRQLSIDRVRFVPDPEGGPDILQVDGPTSSPQPMPSAGR